MGLMFLIIYKPNCRENPMQSSKYLPKAVYIRSCGQRKINVIVNLSAQNICTSSYGQRNFFKIPENQLNFSPRVEKKRVVDRETSMKQLKSQSGSSEKCIMGRESNRFRNTVFTKRRNLLLRTKFQN